MIVTAFWGSPPNWRLVSKPACWSAICSPVSNYLYTPNQSDIVLGRAIRDPPCYHKKGWLEPHYLADDKTSRQHYPPAVCPTFFNMTIPIGIDYRSPSDPWCIALQQPGRSCRGINDAWISTYVDRSCSKQLQHNICGMQWTPPTRNESSSLRAPHYNKVECWCMPTQSLINMLHR